MTNKTNSAKVEAIRVLMETMSGDELIAAIVALDNTPSAPKADAPKHAPKADAPKHAPKADAPKHAPKADAPHAPKADAPHAPKAPKADAPKHAPKTTAAKLQHFGKWAVYAQAEGKNGFVMCKVYSTSQRARTYYITDGDGFARLDELAVSPHIFANFGKASADVRKKRAKHAKDNAPKDNAPKDNAPKDNAPKDNAPKDNAPKIRSNVRTMERYAAKKLRNVEAFSAPVSNHKAKSGGTWAWVYAGTTTDGANIERAEHGRVKIEVTDEQHAALNALTDKLPDGWKYSKRRCGWYRETGVCVFA